MEREELAAWLRLQGTPGVGNASARRLLAAFGLPPSIFTQPEYALAEVVSDRQARSLLQVPADWSALVSTTWDWLQSRPGENRVLVLGSTDYPSALLAIEDPPLLLYGSATVPMWDALASSPPCLAVVGSRNPTPQGLTNAHQFARSMALSRWTIVSGLALGVDGAAHEGALSGADAQQLATIAVVGTGLDRVYPRQHLDLAHRIVRHGLLVSEYPLGTSPTAANFPRRNRLIAGLSAGTLVVEAALRSGSLITAQHALEQGKEVFAIPGSIHATQSRGCHALIKQGAKLVESAQDILEELAPSLVVARVPEAIVAGDGMTGTDAHDDQGDSVLAALGFDPCGLDALQARTGLATAQLQGRLMQLELAGEVARLPGGLFQRTGQA